MRKVAKKVCKLSLFSQLSAPIKSGVRTIDIPVVLPGVTLVSIVLQKRLAVKNLQIKYSGVIYYEPVDPPGVTRDL